jgi:hypothetical protein
VYRHLDHRRVVDVLAFCGGIALSFWGAVGFRASTAGALFVVAVVTFLGLLSIAENVKQAIAGSFVVVYFGILMTLIFARVRDLDSNISRQILSNFTTLTGVIVASYFGTATIETVSANRHPDSTATQSGDVKPLGEML